MCDVVLILVMVKICIGIDDQDSYVFLCDFINMVFGQGECEMFIIYVCKVWFFGLSLKENCEILLLDYLCVYQLKWDFLYLIMFINGGIKLLEEVKEYLCYMDGVMVGCEVYQNLGILVVVDWEIFGVDIIDVDLVVVVCVMYFYIECELSQGVYLGYIICYMLGLFQGIFGVWQWCCYLSENVYKVGVDVVVLEQVLKLVVDKC